MGTKTTSKNSEKNTGKTARQSRVREEKEGAESPKKRSGLGRGLGALIPTANIDEVANTTRPIDVFFPTGQSKNAGQRGGSARQLLEPRPRRERAATGKNKRNALDASEAKLKELERKEEPSIKAEDPQKGVNNGTSSLRREEKKRPTDTEISSSVEETGDSAAESAGEERQSTRLSQVARENAKEDPRETLEKESSDLAGVEGAEFAEIPLELIVPNSRQPREVFDEDDLAELSASIAEVGILQPIVVRPISLTETPSEALLKSLEEKPEARFELIMGERRLRASERAGLTRIPAIIRKTEDGDLLRDALLENLHRAQLNPLEEASAYAQLMADFGTTQEELARRIARSRSQIANTMRLLNLPPGVQRKVAAQVLSAGHARALLSLTTPEEMEILAERIVAEGLSVRTTEELVRLGKVKSPQQAPRRLPRPVSALAQDVVSALQDTYDTRVTITEGRTKGKIVIEFAGPEDLQRIASLILVSE